MLMAKALTSSWNACLSMDVSPYESHPRRKNNPSTGRAITPARSTRERNLIMTNAVTNNRTPKRKSYFTICRGTDGVDETFNLVCKATGRVIASLPFWEADMETKREAQRLRRALDDFYDRGGYFFIDQFEKSSDALSKHHLKPEVFTPAHSTEKGLSS
jgi:hypothetical protein